MFKRSSTDSYESKMKKLDEANERIEVLKKQCDWDGYLRYKKLSYKEKAIIEAEWREYYHRCALTPAGMLWQQMRAAFHEKNDVKIAELQKRAREMLVEENYELLKVPKYPDHTLSIFKQIEELEERVKKLRGGYSSKKVEEPDQFGKEVEKTLTYSQYKEEKDFLDF